jgi:hypothetical protein
MEYNFRNLLCVAVAIILTSAIALKLFFDHRRRKREEKKANAR